MTLHFTVTGFCFIFENSDFLMPAMSDNLGSNFSFGQCRVPKVDVAILGNHQDLFQFHIVSVVVWKSLNANRIALLDAILLAACLYYSVCGQNTTNRFECMARQTAGKDVINTTEPMAKIRDP